MLTKGYCRPFKAQSLYVIGRRHDSVDTTGSPIRTTQGTQYGVEL